MSAAALDGKDLAPLLGALKNVETFDVSSFHLQLLDSGTTTQSLQMAPTKANVRAKIEYDVGDDAERTNVRTNIERDMGDAAERVRRDPDDVLNKLRDREASGRDSQNRSNTHRIKQDLGPQTDPTANAWELRAAYVPRCRRTTDFKHVELAAFYAMTSRPAAKRYLRFARNNPNLDLDTSHWDWIISAL
ncbi:hypothetical protein LTR12_006838 [Friedmanniomyces endolithicus]|nr:hypothetical protein LTR74_004675 [Friedmanniomyces endolithicus]KAK1818788.1 hypothetical protein LTR12_006838 [Friedmanniomyces endolithicus]